MTVVAARSNNAVSARRSWTRIALWLIVGLQTLLMLVVTVIYPPFQNPDEASQVDYVLAHRTGQWWDGPGQRHFQSGVLVAEQLVPAVQFRVHVGATAVPPRKDRKSFNALGTAPSTTIITNQMVQHPPLYYGVAAGWSYLLPGWDGARFDVQVFWLRLLSILLMIPIPLLIYGSAMRLGQHPAVGLTATMIPLSIPSYLRTGASVTNDSLLTLLITAMLALLVRVACGDLSRRTAVLAGLAWGGALLTKGFALALPPAIILAYLQGAAGAATGGQRFRRRLRVALPGMITAGLLGCVLGLWWWVRNVLVYGVVQPNGFGTLPAATEQLILGSDRPGGTEVGFFANFVRLLSQRVWGSVGLLDVPSPPLWLLYLLAVLLLALLVFALAVGLRAGGRWAVARGCEGWTGSRAVFLLLPTVLILGLMYGGARSVYLHGRQLPGIQVRYLVPTLLGIAICAAVALLVLVGRHRSRWVPVVVTALTLLYTVIWTTTVVTQDFSPPHEGWVSSLKHGINFVTGWAPFPGWASAGLVAATVVTALATLGALVGAASASPGSEIAYDRPPNAAPVPGSGSTSSQVI